MPNLWNITLTNQHNATVTCTLTDVVDAIALKRLEIKSEASENHLIVIVEPKPEGIYIKEVEVLGEKLGFRKENGMLLPAAREEGDTWKEGDTWQVSTQKKSQLTRLLFKQGAKQNKRGLARRLFKPGAKQSNRGLATIVFKMDLTVVAAEPQRLVISVNIEVNISAPFKKEINRTIETVVSINPHANFQPQRIQLPNGDIYEHQQ